MENTNKRFERESRYNKLMSQFASTLFLKDRNDVFRNYEMVNGETKYCKVFMKGVEDFTYLPYPQDFQNSKKESGRYLPNVERTYGQSFITFVPFAARSIKFNKYPSTYAENAFRRRWSTNEHGTSYKIGDIFALDLDPIRSTQNLIDYKGYFEFNNIYNSFKKFYERLVNELLLETISFSLEKVDGFEDSFNDIKNKLKEFSEFPASFWEEPTFRLRFLTPTPEEYKQKTGKDYNNATTHRFFLENSCSKVFVNFMNFLLFNKNWVMSNSFDFDVFQNVIAQLITDSIIRDIREGFGIISGVAIDAQIGHLELNRLLSNILIECNGQHEYNKVWKSLPSAYQRVIEKYNLHMNDLLCSIIKESFTQLQINVYNQIVYTYQKGNKDLFDILFIDLVKDFSKEVVNITSVSDGNNLSYDDFFTLLYFAEADETIRIVMIHKDSISKLNKVMREKQ